jgi:hypothetical protein
MLGVSSEAVPATWRGMPWSFRVAVAVLPVCVAMTFVGIRLVDESRTSPDEFAVLLPVGRVLEELIIWVLIVEVVLFVWSAATLGHRRIDAEGAPVERTRPDSLAAVMRAGPPLAWIAVGLAVALGLLYLLFDRLP